MISNQSQLQSPQAVIDSTINITIDSPKSVDVLCGRGKICFHHEGNDRFRMLIAEHANTYKMAPSKKSKMQAVMLTIDIVIARGGRFLIRSMDGSWVDGGKKQGKKKTGRAFRDALRGRVKCITQLRENNAQASRDASDDSSHSNSLDSGDEFDADSSEWFDVSTLNLLMLEPSNNNEWMNTKVDTEIANDLSMFEPSNTNKWMHTKVDKEIANDLSVLEPSNTNEWMRRKVDKEIVNDLRNFFLAEQLEAVVAQDSQSYGISKY